MTVASRRPLMPVARLQIAWMTGSGQVIALAVALAAVAVLLAAGVMAAVPQPACRPVPAAGPHYACAWGPPHAP